jgi:hypothetical protein|tara:strand:+ start:43530 stop:43943 length:414 start_codon:yes stop_codon:yes gene_type:complete
VNLNKRGYIKTVEAFIAIIIILIVVFFLIPERPKQEPSTPHIVESAQNFILNELTLNDSARECIVSNPLCENSITFTHIIDSNIPPGYEHSVKICDTTNCVVSTPSDKDVYVDDMIIASTLKKQNPKIVRLWIWNLE